MRIWGVHFPKSFASENGHCLVKMFSIFSYFIDVKICFIWELLSKEQATSDFDLAVFLA